MPPPSTQRLTAPYPRPARPLDFHTTWWESLIAPPTRFLGHVATRGKRHSNERQNSWRNHFGHLRLDQSSGHQRSSKVKFGLLQRFLTNWCITREPAELQRRAKVKPPESEISKNKRFYEKCFAVITLDSLKVWHWFCHYRVSLVERRWVNDNLTLK